MNPEARKYLADIGRKGGQKSRRKLTKAQARAMVRARTAKRAALRPNSYSSDSKVEALKAYRERSAAPLTDSEKLQGATLAEQHGA